MFTYLNTETDQMLFGVELYSVKLKKLKSSSLDLRLVSLVVGQPGGTQHELDLGLYSLKKDLLEGLATINSWAKDKHYITLESLRKRLSEAYHCPMIDADITAVPQ